nr:MAG TPA: helix-turn-helix protein [Caudoviricetes sp.]
MSQTDFGTKIGVTRGVINNLDRGLTDLQDPLLSLICSVFNVRREWLETGEGEMFEPEDAEAPFYDAMGIITNDDPDSFRKRFVIALAELDDAGLDAMEQFIRALIRDTGTKKDGD